MCHSIAMVFPMSAGGEELCPGRGWMGRNHVLYDESLEGSNATAFERYAFL